MLHFLQAYNTPILQLTLLFSLTLLLVFLKIPTFFLYALHTYIQPDNVGQQNGIKAAIKRPSASNSASGIDGYQSLSSKTTSELKKRAKSKEKFEFDENNAQIFRLKLDEGHLQTRLYFDDYWYCFVYSSLAFSSFLLCWYLGGDGKDGIFVNGSLVSVVLGLLGLFKVIVSIAKVCFEKSASRRSEKQISVLIGFLGFGLGLLISSGAAYSILDFDFGSIDGFGSFFISILMGCIAGFLYIPACKNARSFWLGTDQLRSNLAIISCGWLARLVLYVNYLVVVFTTLIWIKPFMEILVRKNSGNSSNAEKLVGNVGFTESEFSKLRVWCLLLSGIIQTIALRSNLQMYLNEAVLSWYQRLHASKVPDLEFSRAKVFLHNHYLCHAALQFFVPPVLVLLFFGLAGIDGNSFKNSELLCAVLPCHAFNSEVILFMAWWVVFVWAVLSSGSLLLYRRGILYVS